MRNFTVFIFSLMLSVPVTAELKFIPWSVPDVSSTQLLKKREDTSFERLNEVTRSSGANIFARVAPSVVKVLTNEGHGSGIVIGSSDGIGVILTNEHVVAGYRTVGVVFSHESEADEVSLGTVEKIDQISDLAVLRLNEKKVGLVSISSAKNLPQVGEDVHAIGHPVGQDWTYTRGYISQLRKNFSWRSSATDHHVADVIQTQTPINPGNSGGPLLNSEGQLIGINSFVQSESEGINFAVDINSVVKFLKASDNRVRKMAEIDLDALMASVDQNKNGDPDAYLFDFSNNKKVDAIALDQNEDEFIEEIRLDRNENGIPEIIIAESDIAEVDGVLYYFDEDEDGKSESVGVDSNRDKEIDRIIPLG